MNTGIQLRNLPTAITGGIAGTFTGALLHESLKKITTHAPQMELVDMELLSKILKGLNIKVPAENQLLKLTMAGEILSHIVYYTMVGIGNKKNVWTRGAAIGLIAGLSAIVLPKPLGLEGAPINRTAQTKAMTLGLYLIAGLTASAISKWVAEKSDNF